jgi:flagellin
MTIQINTNSSAASAQFHLNRNTQALQKSLKRLASGSRIVHPADDSGGLAVSMKLKSSISRLSGAYNNVQNGISFLEVQDGMLAATGRIVDRMIELKGMSQDMMKNEFDNSTYNNEFQELQVQLYDMSQQTFNGVSLFAEFANNDTDGVFHAIPTDASRAFDNTVSIFVSADGTTGAKVSVSKALLLSALTIDASDLTSSIFASGNKDNSITGGAGVYSFASANLSGAMDLDSISVGVFNQALENIAALRARNGGTMSRLSFASENISTQKTNMQAALGRIVDVDVAEESTRLARNNVLVQASAAMLAQANTNPEIALMLIR